MDTLTLEDGTREHQARASGIEDAFVKIRKNAISQRRAMSDSDNDESLRYRRT
jgi:hypothetical protein